MDEVKILINQAKNEREKGDPVKSLNMFLSINQDKLSLSQIYDYLGELSLTYFHLKDFINSKNTFEKGLKKAQDENNLSYIALFMRQLSRKEFNDNFLEIKEMAIKAREVAKQAGRKDLVWFDQGVISALFNSNASNEEIKKWIEIESNDLLKASREVRDDTALWVWITGMLLERYQYDKDVSNLNLALIISEKFNLERRKEQILGLIKL